VCATEHFAELIHRRPSNRDRLMALDPRQFIDVMEAWRAHFLAGADMPLVGASEEDLRAIAVPACIIPGDDLTHAYETAAAAAQLMPDCELQRVMGETRPIDVSPPEDWKAKDGVIAGIFADFLARRLERVQQKWNPVLRPNAL
jgi:hypothetical protein